MRIQGPDTPDTRRASELASRRNATTSESPENPESMVVRREENVKVSDEAQRLSDVRRDDGVHDENKVERLRQALQNGSFKVDAETIAKRMLEEERG